MVTVESRRSGDGEDALKLRVTMMLGALAIVLATASTATASTATAPDRATATVAAPAPPGTPLNAQLTGDLVPTHDPVIIREGNTYYVFSTGSDNGRFVRAKTSKDLVHWTAAGAL